jgi:hypothetical protein
LPALVLKILRGKYPPLPSTYSKELHALVAAMLELSPDRRPSIRQILALPHIRARIKRVCPGEDDTEEGNKPVAGEIVDDRKFGASGSGKLPPVGEAGESKQNNDAGLGTSTGSLSGGGGTGGSSSGGVGGDSSDGALPDGPVEAGDDEDHRAWLAEIEELRVKHGKPAVPASGSSRQGGKSLPGSDEADDGDEDGDNDNGDAASGGAAFGAHTAAVRPAIENTQKWFSAVEQQLSDLAGDWREQKGGSSGDKKAGAAAKPKAPAAAPSRGSKGRHGKTLAPLSPGTGTDSDASDLASPGPPSSGRAGSAAKRGAAGAAPSARSPQKKAAGGSPAPDALPVTPRKGSAASGAAAAKRAAPGSDPSSRGGKAAVGSPTGKAAVRPKPGGASAAAPKAGGKAASGTCGRSCFALCRLTCSLCVCVCGRRCRAKEIRGAAAAQAGWVGSCRSGGRAGCCANAEGRRQHTTRYAMLLAEF